MAILHETVKWDQEVDSHKVARIMAEVAVEVVVDIEEIEELGGPHLLEEGVVQEPN